MREMQLCACDIRLYKKTLSPSITLAGWCMLLVEDEKQSREEDKEEEKEQKERR